MRRPSLGFAFALSVLAATLVVRCTDLTVNRTADGTTTGVATGPAVPPVEIDREGIHEPPTPTPGPYEPVYPVTPPPPTPTKRAGSFSS
jgi:hypothetical protein